MTLRLWLILFGVLVFMLIVLDTWRKSKSYAKDYTDPEEEAKRAELDRELPYGGSRKSGYENSNNFIEDEVFADDPIPLLKTPLKKNGTNSDFNQTNNFDNLDNLDNFDNFDNLDNMTNMDRFETSMLEPNLDVNATQAPFDFPQSEQNFANLASSHKEDFYDENSNLDDFSGLTSLDEDNFLPRKESDNLTKHFDLEEADLEQNLEEDNILFDLPITKGLVELEKNIWSKGEEHIFIRVMAQEDKAYSLPDFWEFCQEADLRFSERGFVHRFLEHEDRNYIQFSILNAVEPGNFLNINYQYAYTKGFILVQTLSSGYMPDKIVEDMVDIARKLVNRFGGTVLDEDQSALTEQTVKYYKEKIRKNLLKSKLPFERSSDRK